MNSEKGSPPSIVILTGAGISRESGLDTFRDADGIWARVNIEDVATPEGFARHPKKVQEFYNLLRRRLLSEAIKPNVAHLALAKLEREWTSEVTIITQNIDDLHERAGSVNILHMHGELLKARCGGCGYVISCCEDLSTTTVCLVCDSLGLMRPHVVWFGEIPMEINRINQAVSQCGIFIAIGTSGNVYPAASLVEKARFNAAHTVELNLEPSLRASKFAEKVYGPATEIVPEYIHRLLQN
jgi:NAD-dependent deacetylase